MAGTYGGFNPPNFELLLGRKRVIIFHPSEETKISAQSCSTAAKKLAAGGECEAQGKLNKHSLLLNCFTQRDNASASLSCLQLLIYTSLGSQPFCLQAILNSYTLGFSICDEVHWTLFGEPRTLAL